ncbi:MAG: phosphoribosylaminoimidazolesuccinocarboxamide synthase [Acidimicrobiales bacterium]
MTLPHVYRGKVRDVYDAGSDLLLMVASDRVSAFDHVFSTTIPNKGRVLTAMTSFWSEKLSSVAPTHLVSTDPGRFPEDAAAIADVAGRAMLVRRAEMLPIECIVRGYLAGSAWKEYNASQTMHGTPLPPGLAEAARLDEPVFTPSTKATAGHDENISFERAVDLVGKELADQAREVSLAAYLVARDLASARGIIVADTKFELGVIDGVLSICDEIVTPDSSRFWSVETWHEGETPPSFDKQPLRDWAASTGWDMESPPPRIPDGVANETSARYVAAYEMVTGHRFADWWGASA